MIKEYKLQIILFILFGTFLSVQISRDLECQSVCFPNPGRPDFNKCDCDLTKLTK